MHQACGPPTQCETTSQQHYGGARMSFAPVISNELLAWSPVSQYPGRLAVPSQFIVVVVIEGSDAVSHQRLQGVVATSLPRIARFRSRLIDKPLGLGQPVWAEIEDFDPAPQIHAETLSAADPPVALTDLVSGLAADKPARGSPLWEAWSVEGLEGGRWGLVLRMSPEVTSGIGEGVASIWTRLTTFSPRGDLSSVRVEPGPGAPPSARELAIETLLELFDNTVLGAWLLAAAAPAAFRAVGQRLLPAIARAPEGESSPGLPLTIFNARPTSRRSVAFTSIRLAHLKTIAYAFGSTTVIAALAACTMSLRTWLRHYHTVPDHPLVMRMPLSLFGDESMAITEQVALVPIEFPVHIDDPIQILLQLHAATDMSLMSQQRSAGANLGLDWTDFASVVPPSILRAGTLLGLRLPLRRTNAPAYHGTISYLPGPSATRYCAGSKAVSLFAVPPLEHGNGLSISITLHASVMDFSVCVCPDRVPRVDVIAAGIAESVDILLAAAQQSPRGQGPSVITRLRRRSRTRPKGSR